MRSIPRQIVGSLGEDFVFPAFAVEDGAPEFFGADIEK